MNKWNYCPNCGTRLEEDRTQVRCDCGHGLRASTAILNSVLFKGLLDKDRRLGRHLIEQRGSNSRWTLPCALQEFGKSATGSLVEMLFFDYGLSVVADDLEQFDQVDDPKSGILRVCWTLRQDEDNLPNWDWSDLLISPQKGDFLRRKLQDPDDESTTDKIPEFERLWMRAHVLGLDPKQLRKDLEKSSTQYRRGDSSVLRSSEKNLLQASPS